MGGAQVSPSLVDRIRSHLAKVLRIFGRVEVGILGELETHVVFADTTAIGDGDLDALAGFQHVLTKNVILPVVDTAWRSVKPLQRRVGGVLEGEDKVIGAYRTGRRNDACSNGCSESDCFIHGKSPKPKVGLNISNMVVNFGNKSVSECLIIRRRRGCPASCLLLRSAA